MLYAKSDFVNYEWLACLLCPGVVDMGRGMRDARFLLPGVAILIEVGVRSDVGGVPLGDIKEGDPDADIREKI